MKRLLSLILAIVMIAILCAAYAEPDYLNAESRFPIVVDGQKQVLSIATVVTAGVADMEDLWFWKWCDEKLNIQFEIETIDPSAVSEKINLMFAGDTMPDILVGAGLTAAQIVQYGQNDHKLMPLNDLIEEYAPNLTAIFNANPAYKATCTSGDGNIYTFPTLTAESNKLANSPNVLINERWLEACGLEKPTTLDELYDTLLAFKEIYPDSTPLGGGKKACCPDQYIWSALGVTASTTKDDDPLAPGFRNGEVCIIAGDEVYAEYLTFMNKLFKEGLISPDFYTLDETTVHGQVAAGKVGIIADVTYGYSDDWADWTSVIPLTSDVNDTKVWQSASTITIGAAAISANCKKPELAVRFIDTFYDVAYGGYLWNGPITDSDDAMGLVGGWYVDDAGTIIYAEQENGTYSSGKEYLLAKVTPFNGKRPCVKPSNEDMLVLGSNGALSEYKFDLSNPVDFYRSSKNDLVAPYFVGVFPSVYFDDVTNSRINELYLELTDYVSEETAKFITGRRSLDEIDKYFEELNELGFEEYLGYYAEAYELVR